MHEEDDLMEDQETTDGQVSNTSRGNDDDDDDDDVFKVKRTRTSTGEGCQFNIWNMISILYACVVNLRIFFCSSLLNFL